MTMETSLIPMDYQKHQFIIILVMLKMKKISRMVGTGLIYLTKRIQDLKWDHLLGNNNFCWTHRETNSIISSTRCFLHVCVTVSPFSLPVDLSAPRASLRPPALVTLSCDAVKAHGTGNVICKWWLPGL